MKSDGLVPLIFDKKDLPLVSKFISPDSYTVVLPDDGKDHTITTTMYGVPMSDINEKDYKYKAMVTKEVYDAITRIMKSKSSKDAVDDPEP